MIHIERGQKITDNENIFVSSITGDYEDNALIEFYSSDDPEKILGAFAAQYIKYGNIVYQFSDPKELGAEILKIDPESTHTAASFVRMQNELLKQFNQGDLEATSLDAALLEEQVKMEEQMDNPIIGDNATTTSATNDTNTTTSAPIVENVPITNTASTTPAISNPIIENNTTTSTPNIAQVAGTSTTPIIEAPTSSANSSSPTSNSTSSNSTSTGFIDNLINNVVEAVTSTPATATTSEVSQGLVIPATSTANTAQNILEEIIEAATSSNSTTTGI